jgi:hypothetical protein
MPEVVLIQLFSWEWAQICSKHVEDSNIHIIEEIARQVGYLPELYEHAWSEKDKTYIATGPSSVTVNRSTRVVIYQNHVNSRWEKRKARDYFHVRILEQYMYEKHVCNISPTKNNYIRLNTEMRQHWEKWQNLVKFKTAVKPGISRIWTINFTYRTHICENISSRHVRPSVCQYETTLPLADEFSWNFIFKFTRNFFNTPLIYFKGKK